VCFCKNDDVETIGEKTALATRNRGRNTILSNPKKRIMAKRLALSFTRSSQMPTARPAIKEVVEVGALFVISEMTHLRAS